METESDHTSAWECKPSCLAQKGMLSDVSRYFQSQHLKPTYIYSCLYKLGGVFSQCNTIENIYLQEIDRLTKQVEALELDLRQAAKHQPRMKRMSIADIEDDAHLVSFLLFQASCSMFACLQV